MNEPLSVDAIFCAAIELEEQQARESYLDEACRQDEQLKRQVQRLLDAHFRGGSAIDAPDHLLRGTLHKGPPEEAGAQIGPYKLLQQIGEGGMGTVYMAEQIVPVQRRVALKIIKPGMDTRQVIARFEAERQALAMMDHPHIAKVLDAGTTDSGRPYFVMELVRGVPITKYCDEHQLTLAQRLELFLPVCQAIQHAHQKGIIHRDIKPSNVLIAPYDGKPVVKVIDFGVAKATGRQLTEKTLFTEFGAVLGTLEYMSPEQAELNNQDIDTRSDIYSLGVLLYELLTGSTPLTSEQLKSAGFTEMLRLIREQEPPRPSIRLSTAKGMLPTISQHRKVEPAQLTKAVRGELDWIVMKALDKDRNRRYETPNGFAADVQRYLNDEPVQACPPSAIYLIRKFIQRHRGLVAVASLVLATLIVAIATTAWGLVQAELGRTAAEQARRGEATQRAEAVGNLYDSLIGEARALRLARVVGYREQAWQRLGQAAQLDTAKADLVQLRNEAAACLGDFVGVSPKILQDFGDARIRAIAHHHHSRLLAVGLSDGRLETRDLKDGRSMTHWLAHPGTAIYSLAFDPQGSFLASAAADGAITLWRRAEDGRWAKQWDANISAHITPHPHVMTVLFTPDGKHLVASSAGESVIHVWHITDGEEMKAIETSGEILGCLALSPDGSLIAAGITNQGEEALCVWKFADREVLREFTPKLETVWDVAFSPDGKLLALACDAGVAVFDTTRFESRLILRATTSYGLAFGNDSQILAIGKQGATVLWDIVTNREIATLAHPPTAQDGALGGHHYLLVPNPQGSVFVVATMTSVTIWDLEAASEKKLLKRFGGGIPGVAFRPQGDLLACVSKDRTVTLWNPHTGQLVHNLTGCQGPVQAVTFSPNGRWLATGDWSERESVRIWDVASGECLFALDPELDGVWSVAFGSDGQYLAVGAHPGWRVWRFVAAEDLGGTIQLGPIVHSFDSANRVGSVCFTADGSLLAWAERDLSFHLWDLTAGKELTPPVSNVGNYILSVWRDASAISKPEQGKWLWLFRDGTEIWDMGTGQKVGVGVYPAAFDALPNAWKWGWCREFSPDGSQLVVGQADGSLELWDLEEVRAKLDAGGFGWKRENTRPAKK